jgi:hypothetical protein
LLKEEFCYKYASMDFFAWGYVDEKEKVESM